MKQNRYTRSMELWRESAKSIVPASSIIAKSPTLFTYGAYPIYLTQGKGAMVEDVDGNRYVDFQSALGPIILGNRYEAVDKAIMTQLKKGILFSQFNPLQIELADLVTSMVPGAEMIRIFKTGADAVTGAVRIARAYTRRDKIATCHFHGWHDWSYVHEKQNFGIPSNVAENILTFEYNKVDTLKALFRNNPGEIAAVVLEPVNVDEPAPGHLEEVKEIAHKHGALLIFDEVVTGFRFSKGGAQEYFGVTADIACFAKAVANGMPLALITGGREIFEVTKDVITSSTFSEECLSLAAGIATLKEIKTKNVNMHIWKIGEMLKNGFNELAKKREVSIECVGYAPRLRIDFSDVGNNDRLTVKAYFLQETAKLGVLFGNAIFVNYAHTKKQIKESLRVCDRVLVKIAEMKNMEIKIEGKKTEELW